MKYIFQGSSKVHILFNNMLAWYMAINTYIDSVWVLFVFLVQASQILATNLINRFV